MNDLDQIATLHYSSGVDGLLKDLATETLIRYFYRPTLVKKNVKSKVAVLNSGSIIGFSSLSNKVNEYPDVSISVKFQVALELTLKSIKNPSLVAILLNQIKMDVYVKTSKSLKNAAELKVLIIDSEHANQGIGSKLLAATFRERQDLTKIIVRTQNPLALRFYEKHGFHFIKKITTLKSCLWLGIRTEGVGSERI